MTPVKIFERFRSEHEKGVVDQGGGTMRRRASGCRRVESASQRGREVKGHVIVGREWRGMRVGRDVEVS